VTNCELCRAGFEEKETVAEVGCGAVEGCAGEVTNRGDGGAECPSDLALKDVELGALESLKRPSWRVKCFPIRSPRMTRILRYCVSKNIIGH
jgi:hypothetical protein